MKTRKIISILCAASIVLAMTACDKTKETDTDNSSKSETATKASADESKAESIDSAESAVESDVSELSESQKESSSANDSVESKSKDSEAEISDDKAEENTASETISNESDTVEVKNGGLIYHIPSNFYDSKDNANGSSYYAYRTPDDTTASYLIAYSQDFPSLELNEAAFESAAQSIMKGYVKKAETDIDYKPTEIKHNTILERNEYEMGYIIDSKSEEEFDYMFISFIQSPDIESINYVVQLFRFKDHEIDYDYIDDATKMIYSVEEDPDFAD